MFFFSRTPLAATSDESILTLNTANIYFFKVNKRNTGMYAIGLINKDTKMTSNDIVLLFSLDLGQVFLLFTLNKQ